MRFSPLLHSSLRTLAILASQDFHLCPLHPRKELRSSYTRTAAWKCSTGSELQQWQVSSFVSHFSRNVIFYWLWCNVLKNRFRICLLCFCGSLRWKVKFGPCYPIMAKVEALHELRIQLGVGLQRWIQEDLQSWISVSVKPCVWLLLPLRSWAQMKNLSSSNNYREVIEFLITEHVLYFQ